jgi:glucose/arabinose dehydrogenase
MHTSRYILFVVFALIVFGSNLAVQTQTQQPPIRLQPFLSGLSLPVYVTTPRDGTRRLFVVQQRGIIKVVQPGTNAVSDFLNVSGVVSSSGNERGLLGLAFHPQYSTNRRFFIYYTRQSDGAIEIAEYETSAANPNVANPTAIRVIITIPHPTFGNHNGGTVLFGPDGYLYAATGDGGSGNDPNANAQNINSLLGKFIRLDVNTPVGQVPAYNIPPTNPYVGVAGADEIYAVGMRNPYRFSFDRGGTNQLWVGDVGQDAIEEVDIITLGGNYGWRVFEGTQCTNIEPTNCTNPPTTYLPPVFQYSSGAGSPRCSVTGGHVYRGPRRTFGEAAYIYADYCTGEILHWFNGSQVLRLDTTRLISGFGEDEAGELYITGLTSGTVEKIVRGQASADFDGDTRTDLSVYRPGTGTWFTANSSNGSVRIQGFGITEDIPMAEDFDGDYVTDIGVFRPSNGVWYFIRSSDSTVGAIPFGLPGDVPAAADYDGDAKGDLAVFRPSSGTWYILPSMTGSTYQLQFGSTGDTPVVGDYDADGKFDIAVWRGSTGVWYRINSGDGSVGILQWGVNGDVPAQGDFDGDGRTDLAVFRPSSGLWYIYRTGTGVTSALPWGTNGDVPVVADYDGDGLDDIAVFRPSNGTWYRINSSNSSTVFIQFGSNGDLPVPNYDRP